LIVPGKLGHLYEYDDRHLGVIVVPSKPRKNYWAFTRARLERLCFVTVQDGDCEGAAYFDPECAEQAKAAIKSCGSLTETAALVRSDRQASFVAS
jgi:hypothetical protein